MEPSNFRCRRFAVTVYDEGDHYNWHVDAQGHLKSQMMGMCPDTPVRKISLTSIFK